MKKKIEISKYFLLLAVIIVAVIFGIMEPAFLKTSNILTIVNSTCVLGIMGIGLTIVMATGSINFASGSELTLGAIFMAVILASDKVNNYFVALIITFVLVMCIGVLNGIITVKIGVPAFIATLGMQTLLLGFAKYLSNGGNVYSSNWPECFTTLGQSYVFGKIPLSLIAFIIVGAIAWFLTEKTVTGKNLYAVGANPKACVHVGISVSKYKILGFVLCSVFTCFAGIMQGSMLNGATPYYGSDLLLSALSTLFLGATFWKQGVFNVLGTIVAAILLSEITNGMTMIGAPTFLKNTIQGVILLVAVAVIALINRKKAV